MGIAPVVPAADRAEALRRTFPGEAAEVLDARASVRKARRGRGLLVGFGRFCSCIGNRLSSTV